MIRKKIAAVALTAAMACSICTPSATPLLAAQNEVMGIRAATVMNVKSFASDPVEQFVSDLYTNLLGRNADEKGLINWKASLLNGENTASEIVVGFVKSREFQNVSRSNSEYIAVLYRAILGRTASDKDISVWRNVINNGATRMKVLEGMLGSREFASMCSRFGITKGSFKSSEYLDTYYQYSSFIARFYQQCLNRVYDEASLVSWVKSLVNGDVTGTDVARGFMGSKEFANRGLDNEEFIRVCYRTLLNREADEAGFSSWVKNLRNGMSRDEVIESFIWSDEFANYCKSQGIKLSKKPVVNNNNDNDEDGRWVSLGTFKITAYCPCSKCNGNSSGLTYSGTRLTVGRTVAVSRSVIPIGSVLKIDGVSGTRVAEDTGVSGKTIDLLVSSHSGAYDWGVRYREVWIKK